MASKAKPKTTIQTKEKAASKQDQVIGLLRRQEGASIFEMSEVSGWAPHSVRGFMSGALKKRLKIAVISEKAADGQRRYFVAPIKSAE